MRGLLWVLGAFALAVAVSLAFEGDGYLVLVAPPWRIEASLVLSTLVVLAAFVALYWLVRLVSRTLTLPAQVRTFRERQRELKGRRALIGAVQALFEGRYGRAERLAAQAWESGGARALASLVAARSAQRRRDFARCDEWLARARDAEPEWRQARLALQAQLLVEERRFEEARSALQELHAGGSRHMFTLQLLLRCEQELGNWEEVTRIAKLLEKREVMPREALQSIVTGARVAQISRLAQVPRDLSEYWRGIPAEERVYPRIAAAAARAFIQLGDSRAAHRLLQEALEAHWEGELVLLYGECQDTDAPSRIEQAEGWLRDHPRDAELLLTLGRLCIQRELWGKAQSYLEASLSVQATRAAHVALAGLFDRIGRLEDANRHFRASADPSLTQSP